MLMYRGRVTNTLRVKLYASKPRRFATCGSSNVLDEWVEREARPISLRQLTVFGRSLTEARLISSANYVRQELPTRIAHRLRDMQTLPYVVITNPHMSHVYDLYYAAFDRFRRLREVRTVEDNKALCRVIRQTLKEHLTVIPRLVMGVIECQTLVSAERMDALMSTILRSRISRRVIAEQHLALTSTFSTDHPAPLTPTPTDADALPIGEVFLRCNASSIVSRCASTITTLSRQAYGPSVQLPSVRLQGHLDATLTYIPSHLEYVVGELLRNSVQAVVEHRARSNTTTLPPPIDVLICEAPQHVIFRVSDQGGGIPPALLPHLWSFVSGPRRKMRLANLNRVPQLSATLQELKVPEAENRLSPSSSAVDATSENAEDAAETETSLTSLLGRAPNLRLGIGLPMSRVYAEYWAGSLELHSLEGYGVDAFLQVSKLGNRNERLSTRAAMDAL